MESVEKLSVDYFAHWAEAVYYAISCGCFHARYPLSPTPYHALHPLSECRSQLYPFSINLFHHHFSLLRVLSRQRPPVLSGDGWMQTSTRTYLLFLFILRGGGVNRRGGGGGGSIGVHPLFFFGGGRARAPGPQPHPGPRSSHGRNHFLQYTR